MTAHISRMLIVDDDLLQCRIISAVAGRLGIQTFAVGTFDDAVGLLNAGEFDCVTVDLSLDDRSGVELLRTIARLKKVPFVVVISGCEERILCATTRMGSEAGIQRIAGLRKPIDLKALRDTLNELSLLEPRSTRNDRSLESISSERVALGLCQNEIYAAFQPKIDLSNGKVIGCEALARWNCHEHGDVPPDIFIAIAENSGQMRALTLIILQHAVNLCSYFIRHDPSFVMAINISASLLTDDWLLEVTKATLQDTGVPAKCLIFELTESIAIADGSHAVDVLLNLRLMGVGLSIDDFGTGYSTLSTLARMPFTELKIDRSFVSHCLTDEDMWKITRGTIALAIAFNMKVVAEGIEDSRTKDALQSAGCDIGQGYFISRPLRRQAFVKWYDEYHNTLHQGVSA